MNNVKGDCAISLLSDEGGLSPEKKPKNLTISLLESDEKEVKKLVEKTNH